MRSVASARLLLTRVVAIAPFLAIGWFVFEGVLMLPLLGLQSDEVIFIYDLWHPKSGVAWFSFFHHYMPSMVMSYLGGLKSWLYAPLLAMLPVNEWLVRIPALVCAAATIYLCVHLLQRVHSRAAGVVIACVLATDVTFVMLSVFDWGPVVLQNMLLILGILALLRWYESQKPKLLFLAGAILGLALWDKALFLWDLSAMAAALFVVNLRALIRSCKWKNIAIFAAGLFLGAYPLIRYNLGHHGSTIGENTRFAFSELEAKAVSMRRALDGQITPYALVDGSHQARDLMPRPFAGPSLALARYVRTGGSTLGFYLEAALVGIGLFTADANARKWILFFLISGVLAWFESGLTVNAGGSLHHQVLFWIPLLCAVALSAGSTINGRSPGLRGLAFLAVSFICIRALLFVDLAYANLIEYPARSSWTNADRALCAELEHSGVKRAIAIDWGIVNIVETRSNRRVTVSEETAPLLAGQFNRGAFLGCSAGCAILRHLPDGALFPKADQFFGKTIHSLGMIKTNVKTVYDTHGVPRFEMFDIKPVP